ncbi:GntR family transcriptional regulator [Tenuifilaceae bacterium CYCD]|nr:GntR family transcriptional regulator [Tenuifilaceae bacterium CYCD]
MAKIGEYNSLRVKKLVPFGVYLDGGEHGEILMPVRYVPQGCKEDDIVDVFVYLDSEDRIIATTEKPYATVGEFALLKVVAISRMGAFMDWGLPKDLLVPYREQKKEMKEGEEYIVFIYFDFESKRLAASAKIERFLDNTLPEYVIGQEVDLIIINESDLGFNAIIDQTHTGVLYKNEVFQPLKKGDRLKGYIKKVREDEKIDLILQKPGYEKVDSVSQAILDKLNQNNGYIAITDKSDPDDIYNLFQISKKTFKKAIGNLYRERLVSLEDEGIRLIKKK